MAKKGGKRGKQYRGRYAKKGARRVMNSEFASAKQTVDMPADTTNIVYHLNDVNLSQFDRLTTLGRCYQYFRITKITVRFKPFYDTFAQAGAASVPNLYYLVTKSDTLDIGTFNQLKDAGAKSRRFDDKIKSISWRPQVANAVIAEQTATGIMPTSVAWASYRTSPWLSTDASPSDGTLS